MGNLGVAYEVNGLEELAVPCYVEAHRLDPTDETWPYFLALNVGLKDREAGIGWLDVALTLNDRYVPLWLLRGNWMLDAGEVAAANDAFTRADELGAGSPASVGLARVDLLEGRPQEAIMRLESVLENLDHPAVHRVLGQAYRAQGQMTDARIAFARGALDEPLRWRDPLQARKGDFIAGFGGRLVKAENLIKAGAFREARELLLLLAEERPDDRTVISNLSLALSSLGRTEEARVLLDEGIERDPTDIFFRLNRAGLFRESGAYDDALEDLAVVIEGNPDHAVAYAHRGQVLLAQGEFDEAYAAFLKARELGYAGTDKIEYTLGLIQGTKENWAIAAEHFSAAVGQDLADTMAHIYLALCHWELGKADEATASLEFAARLGTHPREVSAVRERIGTTDSG